MTIMIQLNEKDDSLPTYQIMAFERIQLLTNEQQLEATNLVRQMLTKIIKYLVQ